MTNEFDYIKSIIEGKINGGIINKNDAGIYKVSYTFPNLKRITVRGTDAVDITHKLIAKRDIQLSEAKKIKVSSMRFDKIAIMWYETEIDGRDLAKDNRKNYKSILNKHILPRFGLRNIEEIENHELQNYLNELGKKSGKSHVSKVKNCLTNIFQFAYQNRLIVFNPAIKLKLPKCKEFTSPNKERVTNDELLLALKASKNDLQMKIIIEMLFLYGIRDVELVKLRWENINFKEKYIHIKESKYTNAINTKNKEKTRRYLPLPNTLAKDLRTLKESRPSSTGNDIIFIKKESKKPMTTNALCGYFKTLHRDMEILNGAKMFNNKIIEYTGVRHFTPYAFRHGVSSRMDALEFNDYYTQSFIGHAPQSVKDKHYTKLNFETELRPVYNRYMEIAEKELIDYLKQV